MADIIISESQLHVIREYENREVLFGEFSTKARGFINELMKNSLHPNLDPFFKENGIERIKIGNFVYFNREEVKNLLTNRK